MPLDLTVTKPQYQLSLYLLQSKYGANKQLVVSPFGSPGLVSPGWFTCPPASSLLFPFLSTQGSTRGQGGTRCYCGTVQGEGGEGFCWSLPSQEKCRAPKKGEAIGCAFTAALHGASAKPGDCRADGSWGYFRGRFCAACKIPFLVADSTTNQLSRDRVIWDKCLPMKFL